MWKTIEAHVNPFVKFVGTNFIIMIDNAWPHSPKAVQAYLREFGVCKIDWPPKSHDLNPIEHIWDSVKNASEPEITLQPLLKS